jgi:hypothetical protein
MVNHGIELFTLSKDQFKLYFDTLFRLRPEVKIDLFPEKKHVYVRSEDESKILMSELILNVEPKEFTSFEIGLESVIKLNPKKDVTFYHKGNQIILAQGDTALKVITLDPRCSELGKVPAFPELEYDARLHLDKTSIEAWYDYFKVLVAKEGVTFEVADGELSVHGKVENDDVLEMTSVIPTDQEDCKVVIAVAPLIDAFAHWKVYDTVVIHLGYRTPLQLEFGSDLLNIKTIIAPIVNDDD